MTNLLGYLEETIKTYADKTAFAGENGSMTFGSIYEQARRIGSFLAEKEVRRKPVIVYMQKSPEEITAFLGVLYAGGYYVPVDKEMPEERRKNIFRMMPDAWCICEKDTEETGHVLEYHRICGQRKSRDCLPQSENNMWIPIRHTPCLPPVLQEFPKVLLQITGRSSIILNSCQRYFIFPEIRYLETRHPFMWMRV